MPQENPVIPARTGIRRLDRSRMPDRQVGADGVPGGSRRRCLLLAVAMLSGCALVPEIGPDRSTRWQQRRDRVAAITRFGFGGRFALRTSRETLNARIRWRQDEEEYRVRLGGLIGEAAVELRGGPAGVELRDRDGVHRADSPESLLQERFGWSFPVQGLRYWVLGTPAPGPAVELLDLDRQGRPARIVQSGWRIVYRRYTSAGDVALPERLDFDREELEARLAVSRWTLGD